RDRCAFQRAERSNHLLREGGLERYAVTPQEIHAIEPALHGEFYGGFYTPSDATGDIHKFTRGLAEACIRHGAKFHFNQTVTDIAEEGQGYLIKLSDTHANVPAAALRAD